MADIVTGSRVVFRIDGQKVAYATTVSYNEQIEYEPADILDQLEAAEHVPTGYVCDFSAELFRIADKSVKQLGIFPILDDIFTAGVLTAEFIDRPTGKTLALLTGVKASGRSGSITAKAASRETISFVALRMIDESEA